LEIYLKEKNKWNYSELNLEELLLVSEVEIREKEETDIWEGNLCSVKVKKTDKEKCIRCWNYRDLVNSLCLRCKNIFI
jgi:hypothetical protein